MCEMTGFAICRMPLFLGGGFKDDCFHLGAFFVMLKAKGDIRRKA